MERGNTKHGPMRDQKMAHETQGMVRGSPRTLKSGASPNPSATPSRRSAAATARTRARPGGTWNCATNSPAS
jgi:hypothetical protein